MSVKRLFRPSRGAGHLPIPFLAVALLALVGVGVMLAHGNSTPSSSAASGSSATATPPLGVIQIGDYPSRFTYSDLKKLKHDADTAIIGTVIAPLRSGMQPSGDFAYTDWQVQLVSVVYDRYHVLVKNGKSTVSTILIRQMGGTVNGVPYISRDDPAMHVGDRALFFLRAGKYAPQPAETTTTVAAVYSVIGDAMGRFQITDGTITRNVFGSIRFAQPMSETAVTSQVQALAA